MTGQDRTEDDYRVAGMDAQDVGETPHLFDSPVATSPRVPPRTDWEVERIERARAAAERALDKIARRVPFDPAAGAENIEVPADDVADLKTVAYQRAWTTSLAGADVADLAHWRLDALAADQHPDALSAFVQSMTTESPRVRTLILTGGVGPGKSSASVALGWAALEIGLLPRFVSHATLMRWLRPDGQPKRGAYSNLTHPQMRSLFYDADVLILDDLGAAYDADKPVTQHVKDETLALLNARIDTPGKFTIISTNHTSGRRNDAGELVSGLSLMFGDQLLSRLSKRGHALTFNGPDRRGRLSW